MDDLNRYCDLTPNQIAFLRDPANAHPEARAAFIRDGLMLPNGQLSPDGQKALEIATEYLSGQRLPSAPLILVNGDVHFIPDREQGLYAAHLKALLSLAQSPGLAWRWMCTTYGPQTLQKLWSEGLIFGRPVRGAPQYITVKGLEILEKALQRAGVAYTKSPTEAAQLSLF